MKRLAIAGALLLAACTPQQAERAGDYQQAIAAACNIAMGLAPMAGPVAPWIIGGCISEEAIARLALDPNSLAWVNDQIAKVRAPRSLL